MKKIKIPVELSEKQTKDIAAQLRAALLWAHFYVDKSGVRKEGDFDKELEVAIQYHTGRILEIVKRGEGKDASK